VIATLGHGARSAAELVWILQAAQIRTLIDVRAFPTSKRNPQFSRAPLSATLELEAHGHKVVHLLAPRRTVEHAAHPQEALWRDV
jgi:uncharacterized protein (DUF488 family)